jgi:Flp pilus assembly protein TadG
MVTSNFIWRAFNRLANDRRGASALEFAMVGLPMILLLMGSLEMGLVFILNLNLNNATASMARNLRVGTNIAPGASVGASSGSQLDLSDFKTALCAKLQLVPSATCLTQLQVDVRALTAFTNQTIPNPISNSTFSTSGFCFYSGTSGSVVLVRTYYLWPVITPAILSMLVNVTTFSGSNGTTSGQWMALQSTQVFKNEPGTGVANTTNSC